MRQELALELELEQVMELCWALYFQSGLESEAGEAEAEADADIDAEAAEADADADAEAGADAEADADAEAGADAEADAEAEVWPISVGHQGVGDELVPRRACLSRDSTESDPSSRSESKWPRRRQWRVVGSR